MRKIISFPHLGNYFVPVKYLLKQLTNLDVWESPPITKKTLELGSKYSPNDVCIPFKYNLGNFIESLENGANILVQAGGGCRYRYYAEVQEKILRDLGYEFDFIKLISKDKIHILEVYNTFKNLNPKLSFFKFLHTFFITLFFIYYMDKIDIIIRKRVGFEVKKNSFKKLKEKMYQDFSKCNHFTTLSFQYLKYKKQFKQLEIKKPKNCLKVGIIGELYTSMEEFSSYFLEEQLASMNIEVKRYTDLSYLLWKKRLTTKYMLFKTRKYCKYTLGADGLDNVYRTLMLSKKYDGIIHTKPFGCTPEVGAIPIIKKVANDKNIPIIFFSYDCETSKEGINTRLEAFYDLIKFRKETK
ncbi:MAG: hypothetical protein HFJ12_01260 [Bacilli bacterium]|nr:hypothetical protein [Bacilli bacterium]